MDDELLTAEQAAAILRCSTRQVYRYAAGDTPQLASTKAGRRMLFPRTDVEALADALNVAELPAPSAELALMPAGDVLAHIRDMQALLNQAHLEIGRLQGQLEQRLLPSDVDDLRARAARADMLEAEHETLRVTVATVTPLVAEIPELRARAERTTALEAELVATRAELERARRPWWRRWARGD